MWTFEPSAGALGGWFRHSQQSTKQTSHWILRGITLNSNWSNVWRGISRVVMNDLVLFVLWCFIIQYCITDSVLYSSCMYCWIAEWLLSVVYLLLNLMYLKALSGTSIANELWLLMLWCVVSVYMRVRVKVRVRYLSQYRVMSCHCPNRLSLSMGLRGVAAGANPSLVSGRGQGTPWISRQLITGPPLSQYKQTLNK